MCANPKCRVDGPVLGRCRRCGEEVCSSCGYRNYQGVWHDGRFCLVANVPVESQIPELDER
ncbi:MAG: hypothetical protein M5U01_41495 [Ardenticatenaceae bacterium]|nr:hypothetical protein [Ardenticatenaceae bacterium]